MSKFGDNLKRLRTERGLTIRQLSEMSHTYETRLWAYEGGAPVPNDRILHRIARALGVEVQDLLGKKDVSETTHVPATRKRKPVIVSQEDLDKIDRSTFGGNLKYLRLSKGISMAELARMIGVAPTTLSTYETNPDKAPSPDRIVEISNALGIPVGDLFPDDNQREVIDDYELRDYLTDLKDRNEIRTLFSLSKDATKEDIDQTLAILSTLRGNNGDNS